MAAPDEKEALRSSAQALLRGYFSGKNAHELLEMLVALLRAHGFDDHAIDELLTKARDEQQTLLPVTLLQDPKLSPLETIVKYLKENRGRTYHQIADLLKRDDRTIWVTYSRAKKKQPAQLNPATTQFLIPALHLADRTRSVLEHVVTYLHDTHKLRFADIARLLKRDDTTVWTVYKRSTIKGGAE